MLMGAKTRARWRQPAPDARTFRAQQYAPPRPPPPGMIHIYISGDAEARKKDHPLPPAGYGVVVVIDGRAIFEQGGPVTAAYPYVHTTTENVALLAAITTALKWARTNPLAAGHPICIRYTSEYAARICTGAWKAKRHKPLALEAIQEWKQLRRVKNAMAWTQHAPHSVAHIIHARGLAATGKSGTRVNRALGRRRPPRREPAERQPANPGLARGGVG